MNQGKHKRYKRKPTGVCWVMVSVCVCDTVPSSAALWHLVIRIEWWEALHFSFLLTSGSAWGIKGKTACAFPHLLLHWPAGHLGRWPQPVVDLRSVSWRPKWWQFNRQSEVNLTRLSAVHTSLSVSRHADMQDVQSDCSSESSYECSLRPWNQRLAGFVCLKWVTLETLVRSSLKWKHQSVLFARRLKKMRALVQKCDTSFITWPRVVLWVCYPRSI